MNKKKDLNSTGGLESENLAKVESDITHSGELALYDKVEREGDSPPPPPEINQILEPSREGYRLVVSPPSPRFTHSLVWCNFGPQRPPPITLEKGQEGLQKLGG